MSRVHSRDWLRGSLQRSFLACVRAYVYHCLFCLDFPLDVYCRLQMRMQFLCCVRMCMYVWICILCLCYCTDLHIVYISKHRNVNIRLYASRPPHTARDSDHTESCVTGHEEIDYLLYKAKNVCGVTCEGGDVTQPLCCRMWSMPPSITK